ncbi:hypothetical protein N7516_003925 [Penicillium verrucosum]|uniref:uncharacterized protein n=1 Tax=Penicillium verrucosum TaxID=60171 RepID=UPI0025455C92|nr:uncharacterized protein N7516_003925 [Penicillium verrucosum]KAJ5943757.1 hypothetical protein N7516_003925 [Penicillium verrucosum]
MSSPLDSTPANSVITQQSCHSDEYALDKEISLYKIKSADEALAMIHGSGIFNHTLQPKQRQVFDMIVEHFRESLLARPDPLLLNIDGKAGTGKSHLIMLLSATLTRIAREAGPPHVWFVQQLTRWHINGQLTPDEHLNVMVTPSPRVTTTNPPYTGDQKEPDTFISYFGSPSLHEPRIVIEVGFRQTYLSLVEDAKLWLEGVGACVRKILQDYDMNFKE